MCTIGRFPLTGFLAIRLIIMNRDQKFITIGLTLATAVFVSSFFILLSNFKLALLSFLIIPLCVAAYLYPRPAIWVFLIYLPFSGTITYLVPGVVHKVGAYVTFNETLYGALQLAKDIFYFPALLAILVRRQTLLAFNKKYEPLTIAIGILCLTSLLTLVVINGQQAPLSDRDQPFLVGIVGLKVLIGYIPLIICGYYLIRHKSDILWFNRIFTLIIVIACGLALVQYYLLVTGICAGNANLPEPINTKVTLQARCLVGGSLLYNPRRSYLLSLPGTFVSPWQWSWFLISASFLTYATSFSDPSRRWRVLGWIAMFFVLGAAIICGQWTAFLVTPSVFVVLMTLTEKSPQKRSLTWGIIAIVSLLLFSQLGEFRELIGRFISRWQYSPPTNFMVDQFQWLSDNRLTLLGRGLGRASSLARRLGEIRLIETFYVKVIYEIGILGFLAFLGVVTTLTVQTFKAYRSLKSKNLKTIGLCLWIFILFISYNSYYYPLAVDPVAVYYWLFGGVLLKLPEIEEVSLENINIMTMDAEKSPNSDLLG